MQATWWEKTVEYDFVIRLSEEQLLDFAAPIAGRTERLAGDAIFGNDNKLILVEFKREHSDIKSEKSISYDYDKAASALNKYYHHWIVYGGLTEEGELGLANQKYFNPSDYFENIADILTTGVTHSTFMQYVDELKKFKKPDARGSGGVDLAVHVPTESVLTVMGVSNSGKLIGSMSLEQYRLELQLAPQGPSPDHTPSWIPRMRR